MNDAVELLDALDLAIGRARGVLPDDTVDSYQRSAKALRSRRGFAGDVLVLAIAGGTGSGKSSLLNAIAGEHVSSVSRLRPHTDVPMAWIPAAGGPGLQRLLDDLGVEQRVIQEHTPNLAVIDLPDMDSVAEWHRTTVEDLLPKVDAVLWIFDPEKYRDVALHEDFLVPLVAYRDQFVFVLNKMDRLPEEDKSVVVTHLMSVLSDDGFEDPRVFPLSASPPSGVPEGVDRLKAFLTSQLDAKKVSLGKLVADVSEMTRDLAEDGGLWQGASINFEDRWGRVRDATAHGLLPASGPASQEDALCRVEDFVAAISVETGGEFGAGMRHRFGTSDMTEHVEAAQKAATAAMPEPAGRRRRRKIDMSPVRLAASHELEERIGRPLRKELWRRAVFGGAIVDVGVRAAQLEARIDNSG